MAIYSAKMPWGETLTISANLIEASATIHILGPNEDWFPTPYQTADARHRERDAFMLAVEYRGREWFAAPNDKRPSDEILKEISEKIKTEEIKISYCDEVR